MNQTFYEPTEQQLQKFKEINALSEATFDRRCASYNNCTICPMALHIGMGHNRCTYGMSEMEFQLLMLHNDCNY